MRLQDLPEDVLRDIFLKSDAATIKTLRLVSKAFKSLASQYCAKLVQTACSLSQADSFNPTKRRLERWMHAFPKASSLSLSIAGAEELPLLYARGVTTMQLQQLSVVNDWSNGTGVVLKPLLHVCVRVTRLRWKTWFGAQSTADILATSRLQSLDVSSEQPSFWTPLLAGLSELLGLRQLKGARLTDQSQVHQLSAAPSLEVLELYPTTAITSLAGLSPLTRLQSLNILHSFTDSGSRRVLRSLPQLSALPRLQEFLYLQKYVHDFRTLAGRR